MPDTDNRRIFITDHHCPGDTLEDTAAVHELKMSHPGLRIGVRTTAQELWDHNPDIDPGVTRDNADVVLPIAMPLIHQSNQNGLHVIDCIRDHLEQRLGLHITPLARKPVLYLSAEEEGDDKWFADRGIPDRYWLINAGHKSDYTVKFWGRSNYQRLVELTRHKISWVQVGAKDAGHTHRPLDGVIDMIGKTSHRDLVRLAYRSSGAVTGMSYLMHLSAIRWRGHGNTVRPCVVIAGGREPDAFTMYPGQHRFSSVGLLPCCSNGGCWKSRTGEDCQNTVKVDGETVPACMACILPEDVARRVLELDALQDAMWPADCHA